MIRAGDRMGPYTLIERRGAGGMGVVWEAQDQQGRQVALKHMHEHLADDPELVRRFRREYEVGIAVRHPNLVRMLDYNGSFSPPYLVMEFVGGKSLRRLLDLGGQFYEWETAVVGAQVASAIAALNGAGVIHRDLKASNIVVDKAMHVTIIDYGIAKVVGEATVSLTPSFIGSAEYSPPENYLGRPINVRSDVYSEGIVLYEMLANDVPFRSDRYTDTLRMHAEMPIPQVVERNPLVSQEMNALVYSMLQKQPERRPAPEQVARVCTSLADMLGHRVPGIAQSAAPATDGQASQPVQRRAASQLDSAPPPPGYLPQASYQPVPSGKGTQPVLFVLAAVGGLAFVAIVLAMAASR